MASIAASPLRLRAPLSFCLLLVLSAVALVSPAAAQAGNPVKGALLFRDKGCAHCHGVGGVGTAKAPALIDIRKDKFWTPAKMTDQILNGGQKMPPFADSLTDPEVANIIAYLRAKVRPAPPAGAEPPTPATPQN